MIKIDSKIINQEVISDKPKRIEEQTMSLENKNRPEVLEGSTYKIKSPISDFATYVTINNEEIDGKIVPREIFINSKNMEHFQWIAALTCLISAIFRKGGNIEFIVEELNSIFNPGGGYFKGKKFIPSLVSEIGDVIKTHFDMLKGNNNKQLSLPLEEAAKPAYTINVGDKITGIGPGLEGVVVSQHYALSWKDAILCSKCNYIAVVKIEGCSTCLNCGDSKCS
jgi:hypothetical protein